MLNYINEEKVLFTFFVVTLLLFLGLSIIEKDMLDMFYLLILFYSFVDIIVNWQLYLQIV